MCDTVGLQPFFPLASVSDGDLAVEENGAGKWEISSVSEVKPSTVGLPCQLTTHVHAAILTLELSTRMKKVTREGSCEVLFIHSSEFSLGHHEYFFSRSLQNKAFCFPSKN